MALGVILSSLVLGSLSIAGLGTSFHSFVHSFISLTNTEHRRQWTILVGIGIMDSEYKENKSSLKFMVLKKRQTCKQIIIKHAVWCGGLYEERWGAVDFSEQRHCQRKEERFE